MTFKKYLAISLFCATLISCGLSQKNPPEETPESCSDVAATGVFEGSDNFGNKAPGGFVMYNTNSKTNPSRYGGMMRCNCSIGRGIMSNGVWGLGGCMSISCYGPR